MVRKRRQADLAAEMSDAEFGDARLTRRLGKILEAVQEAPDQSFPSLFDDGQLEGAYRFFNNEAVTPEAVLRPHVVATVARMAAEPVALVVHDTTTMSFDPDGSRRGLGRVRSSGQAFFAHVSLALSGDGTRTPLGVVALSHHVRKGAEKKKKVKTKDNRDNERDRWGRQVTAVGILDVDRSRVVHVMDREADSSLSWRALVTASSFVSLTTVCSPRATTASRNWRKPSLGSIRSPSEKSLFLGVPPQVEARSKSASIRCERGAWPSLRLAPPRWCCAVRAPSRKHFHRRFR
jgi:hypothetical protein